MRILVAVDKFKGSLTSAQVAHTLATPLTAAGHEVKTLPLADGGDGTVACALACGFDEHTARVTGPLGNTITAQWASTTHGDRTTAVIELAQASGLAHITPTSATARTATTRGTGELIVQALQAGCTEIVLGVGGSATTDAGLGMLTALGVTHSEWQPGTGVTVDTTGLIPAARKARFVLASDVENPLTGPTGAAAVYAPQKGATPSDVDALEMTLESVAQGLDPTGRYRDQPGAGAAGGTGFAALAVLGAELRSGADYLMELTGFHDHLAQADVLVTGEGRFDEQSLQGKGPVAALQAANTAGIPAWVVCGSSAFPTRAAQTLTPQKHHSPAAVRQQPVEPARTEHTDRALDIAGIYALTDLAEVDECMRNPRPLLKQTGVEIAQILQQLQPGG